MIEIFKLNIQIIRERFKIYGFFNIISLFAVIFGILFGFKFIQFKIGYYNEISMFFIAIILATSFESIIPKNIEKNIFKVKTYFNKLDYESIENFYMYKNLGILYILLIFIIFPLNLNYFGNFTFFLMIASLIVCFQMKIKNKFSNEKYTTISAIIKALLLVISYTYTHRAFVIPFDKILNVYTIIIYLVVSLFLIKNSFKLLYEESNMKNSLYLLNISKQIFKVFPNRDLIFAIRTNLLIESIFTIFVVNLFVEKSNSISLDSILTCILSYTGVCMNIYMSILKEESSKLLYFYSCKEFNIVKKEKIKSTLYISLPIFIATMIPLLFIIKFNIIVLSYIVSTIIFSFSAFIIKISLDTNNDVTRIINTKQIVLLFILSTILSIVIANILKSLII
ncbi:MAG: hypothetical protein ACLR2K_10535 [Paraclostridium sordellii]